MINDVIISRLDNLIGEFDTPFFNYLLYSYGLSFNECESIINQIRHDIYDNKISNDNLFSVIESYFRNQIISLEKESKIQYLNDLINEENDFFLKFLKKYNLSSQEINIIYNKVKSIILKDNISDFEIKRYLKYYFLNTIKQESYLKELNKIVGKNYDTLIIKKAKRLYPVLLDRDIIDIIFNIKSDVIAAREFKDGIKHEFLNQCMKKSEAKKAEARVNLSNFVDGKGDSFLKLIESKKLTRKDGDLIVLKINKNIDDGLIQPNMIDNYFLTKQFNEYILNEIQ